MGRIKHPFYLWEFGLCQIRCSLGKCFPGYLSTSHQLITDSIPWSKNLSLIPSFKYLSDQHPILFSNPREIPQHSTSLLKISKAYPITSQSNNLFFFSKSLNKMGQTSLSCEGKPNTPRDLFSQQLNIYQWRANPNNNIFLARATFKNAYTQKQELKFAEFLREQEQENYLEIYKFKEEVQDYRKLSNQDVIVFEKYACTLAELTGRLRLEDVLYVLHGLLIGFEEIRKIYERIVVEDSCCFVTNEGEVRAWINPNPKCNDVWTGLQEDLSPQINIRNILTKIVNLAEKTAIRTLKSEQFFRIMYTMLSKGAYKHCYYADLRRFINEFCYINSIQMSKNLINILKLKESQSEFRKSYKREQRNTQASYNCRQKVNYLPTSESQSNLQAKSLLLKSKSLENHGFNTFSSANQNVQTQGSEMHPYEPIQNTMQTVSHIFPKRPQQPRKSNTVTGIQRNSYVHPKQQKKQVCGSGVQKGNRASTFICSDDFKKSSFVENQILEVQSGKSNSKTSKQYIVNGPTPFQCNQKIINQQKPPSKTDKGKKGKESQAKPMQISIVENMKNENFPPSNFQRPEAHYRTCMDRHSLEQSSQSEVCWSRPWITTKTLTRLISDHDAASLKNSIAESSDYYNESVYSGALTHLGRDIAPPNADRSKTVRISRDR